MKKPLYYLALLCLPLFSIAQTNVSLKINHKLGSQSFSFSQDASNNQGDPFQVTRLEYYIAEIKLTYDGGMDTTLQDFWILVDPSNPTNASLGTFNITSLESVSFGVGVQSAVNHLDPSSYSANHPLAPKSPSMHWGWTAGYRFVAMEGTAASKSEIFQIHALGDANYQIQTIQTTGKTQGSDLVIDLDADYERALENITINAGLVNHGSNGEAATLLDNFKDHVFSEAGSGIGLDERVSNSVSIYPNPVIKGGTIQIEDPLVKVIKVKVLDISGKLILEGSRLDIESESSNLIEGSYIISIEFKDGSFSNNKLLITQ